MFHFFHQIVFPPLRLFSPLPHKHHFTSLNLRPLLNLPFPSPPHSFLLLSPFYWFTCFYRLHHFNFHHSFLSHLFSFTSSFFFNLNLISLTVFNSFQFISFDFLLFCHIISFPSPPFCYAVLFIVLFIYCLPFFCYTSSLPSPSSFLYFFYYF